MIYVNFLFKCILLFSLFLICVVSCKILFLIEKDNCWNSINFKKMEKILSQSPIVKSIPFYKYSGIPEYDRKELLSQMMRRGKKTHFIFFFNNNIKAFSKKIQKPVEKSIAALAGYHFSQWMNFKLVPPTVIRGEYLTQLFVDSKADRKYREKNLLKTLKPIEKSDIYIYYFLFGGLDPKIGNILIGEKCNKVALVDNDSINLSHIQYGDYPFVMRKNKEREFPILNIDDYKKFPFHKVQSLKFSSSQELKMYFQNIGLNMDFKKDVVLTHLNNLSNHTLHIIKWKNIYWLKENLTYHKQLRKDFKPTVFSKKTLRNLKKLSATDLKTVLSHIEEKFNHKMNANFKKSYIASILHRRDVLLKEAKKLAE